MHKQEIMTLVRSALEEGTITAAEVRSLADDKLIAESSPEARIFHDNGKLSGASILYLIGGVVILIGIGTLVFRFWDDLSGAIRILLTLGLAVAMYVTGLMLRDNEELAGVAAVAQLLSGILFPIGLYVLLYQSGVSDLSGIGWGTLIALLSFVVYGVSFFLFRSTVLAMFSVLFGVWSIYAVVGYAIDASGH